MNVFFCLLRDWFCFVFSLSRFSHPSAAPRFSFVIKKHRTVQIETFLSVVSLFKKSSSSSGFLYTQTHHQRPRNKIRTNQYYHGVEEAGANDRAIVERRDDNNKRHSTNFEKSSPVENYRPSVGPGVAKRPGFGGGLSRESAGVVPARERQDTKLGTRSRV